MALETDWPVERFLIEAVPENTVEAVTVSWTVSPALKLMPEKS